VSSTLALADSGIDRILYCQVIDGKKTVFLVDSDGGNQQALVTAKDVGTYLIRNHILYFTDHQLFKYIPATGQSKLLGRFEENTLSIQDLSGIADSSGNTAIANNPSQSLDQAVILAVTPFEQNLYILDFSDDSIRSVSNSSTSGAPGSSGASSLKSYSPDRNALVVVRQVGMKLRFEMSVQEKHNERFIPAWSLPQDMTVIPDLPVWSPDSRRLAFYARPYDGISGFYSLYLYNLAAKEMHMVQGQVFSTIPSNDLSMGVFKPEWSKDGKSLIFPYQTYGPSDSLIIKYEVAAGKKITLNGSRGHNLHPSWSPSGKSILFISNREAAQDQVFTMDGNGENLKQLSPAQGYTEWARWYEAG
jgi:Periplasmic component of the Tol biopolymer transport system